MAKMIPEIKVEKGARGERRFYKAIKEWLPDEFTVYHSLSFVSVEEGRGIYEHEIDFLIIHRELGFLVVEVKGGDEIIYIPKKKQWISVAADGKRHVIRKDPYQQASDNMHWLKREIMKRGVLDAEEEDFPFTHGYAVAFPDAEVKTRHSPPHIQKELTLDQLDIESTSEIEKLMKMWQRKGKGRHISEKEYNDLCNKFLMPEFKVVASIARRMEDEKAELVRLTEEQSRILDYLKNHKRALIQGYAGTGKTQLAMEKARRLAAEGKSVLILCFNSLLARYLDSMLEEEEREAITVDNYHNLAIMLAQKAEIPYEVPPAHKKEARRRFWDLEVPELLIKALEKLGIAYDAVIIDEGQDFKQVWGASVFKLLKDAEDGHLYIFYDERQNIYKSEMWFPVEGEPFLLSENCRNTQRICELATHIGEVDPDAYIYENNPPGEKVSFKPYRDSGEQPQIIAGIVERLLKKGIRPGQITVLSPRVREKSCMAEVGELAGCPLLDYEERMPANTIAFSPLKRFKGLESDVIIFCDMNGKFPIHDPLDQYVTVSRAKHLLFVVHDREWSPPAK